MPYSLSSITNGLKKLQRITKELSEIELREAIIDQKSCLLDAKEEILRLRSEIADHQKEAAEQANKKKKQSELLEVEGFKFDQLDGRPIGLPYCPKCEVKEDGKLYRLIRSNDQYSHCPNCKVDYNAGASGRVHEKRSNSRTVTGPY